MIYKARTLSLLLTLLAACAASTPARTARSPGGPPRPDAPRWREFTSAEGGFTVWMPGEPKVSTQKLPPPEEHLSMREHSVEAETSYSVAYLDYTHELEGTSRVGPFLTVVRDGAVRGVGGRLLEDAEASFDGHPGRVYRFEFDGGFHMRCRTFVVGRRLYVILASTYGTKAPNEAAREASEAAAERFMQSFVLHRVEIGERQRLPLGDPKQALALLTEGEVDKLLKSLPEGSVLKGFCAAKFCRKVEGAEYEFKVLKNPAPAYPDNARAAGASGQVFVRILADEEGRVVASQAEKGHPLLRRPAEVAARNMRVSPVRSKGGSPSKFTGLVVYTFVVR